MINLYNSDCMEALKGMDDNQYDLAIVDPPYGIGINMNMGLKKGKRGKHERKDWDDFAPSDKYFQELFRISSNQIIWGGNYFDLPPNRHFIFWDKLVPSDLSFSDGEYAWTSFDQAIKKFTMRNSSNGIKTHPTQKPIALYKWLLKNYAKEGDKILDTHGGSMSIALACHDMKFDLDLYEIDKDYFEAGKKRYNNHIRQLQLF